MDLFEATPVQEARRKGEQALFASIPDADEASRARFAEIAPETTLNALVGIADGYTGEDLPRLIQRTPRRLHGKFVPGNRGLHDNPDTFYRLVPLDHQSDFILEGEASSNPATIFELSALSAQWHTLGHLTKSDLLIRPGSSFRIHFGAKPGPEVDHFVELSPDAEMLLIRETLAEWAVERPSRLTIENRVDRGGPRERDDEARIEAAAARVDKWFYEAIRLTRVPLSQPANHFPEPVISGEHGKLVTMAYSIGHFWLRPGEALVLTLDPGSAEYVGVPITNLWGTTNPGLARNASWNSKQAALNADGSFTCVLALEDPGVHNWLDPEGLARGFLFLRWAGLDTNRVPDRLPALATRLVPASELRDTLTAETRWVDATERRQIQSERERDHALRFEEFIDE
jgi:hypothetical protein